MKNLIISSLFVTAALLAQQTPATSPSTPAPATTDQTGSTKPMKAKKNHHRKAKKTDGTTTIAPNTKAPASK